MYSPAIDPLQSSKKMNSPGAISSSSSSSACSPMAGMNEIKAATSLGYYGSVFSNTWGLLISNVENATVILSLWVRFFS